VIRTATLALVLTLALAAPAAAGGSAISPDPLQYVSPSRSFTTVHTSLDLDIDLRGQTIAGKVTHTMRSLRPTLDEISLNCVELAVESVKVDGRPADFDYPVAGNMATSWISGAGEQRADDRLVIHLPTPMKRGDEFQVEVAYHGSPKRGLYWIAPEEGIPDKRYEVWSQGEGENNRFWIPCHDYPDDHATYEGRFRVEKGFYVLSNGLLVSQEDKGDKSEFLWRLDQPQVSYLIMVAAARYDVHEEDADGVKLMYLVPPGTDEATVERAFGQTADMIDFYSKTIGIDYPYSKYAQVVVQNFIHGGMENTTATVMNSRILLDERAALTKSEEGLVAHELAHMWWGDMVTCREWTHMWLNEGFATYYQSLYRRYHDGDDAFRYEILQRHRATTDRDDRDARPVVTEFYNRKDARNNANIYIKGSSVLHMLRFLLGDDLYRGVVQYYGEKYKFGPVETSDFARAVKDFTGENLDWFFEQWIYLAGHPKFEVTKRWDEDSKTLELAVRQTQKTGGLVPVFRVPLDVEITCDEGVDTHRITVDRDSQEFFFPCPSRPKMVIFDKGDWVLKTLDFPKREDELLYQLEHGDYIGRVRAADALGHQTPSDDVVAALRGAVTADGHYGLRREAALALGELGGEKAMQALFDGLGVEEARVRLACAEALGKFRGRPQAEKRLAGLLKTDPAYDVRARAVQSLVAMRAAGARDACLEALSQESYQGVVRSAGLRGLATLKETGSMAKVARYAGPGNDRTWRHAAIESYAKLASDLKAGRERERAVDFLAGMLDDWFIRTRQAVITALQTVHDPSAIPYLERTARRDPLEQLRAQATRAAAKVRASVDEEAEIEELEAKINELEGKIERLESDVRAARQEAAGQH
jgi:aminopeptidase N